jgi:hypothetical protein
MSKKVTMKAKKVTKSVTKKAQPKKKVVAKKVVKKAVPKKKVIAKKAVVKKAVAKKISKKEAIKEQYTKLYKIVTNYSENLMQDVYSVVYRTKTLKRFVNENLANRYIGQEILLRMNEHAISTAKKSRAVAKEIEAEFE